MYGRYLIMTKEAGVGRCYRKAREGDYVWLILGYAMPMILRPIDGHYELLGRHTCMGLCKGRPWQLSARGRNDCENLSFSEISRISMNQLEKNHVSRGSSTNDEAD
jgi:hypothetical protein